MPYILPWPVDWATGWKEYCCNGWGKYLKRQELLEYD